MLQSNRLAAWTDLEDLVPIDVADFTKADTSQHRRPLRSTVTPVTAEAVFAKLPTLWRKNVLTVVVTFYVDCVPIDAVQQVLATRCNDKTFANSRRPQPRGNPSLTCRALFQVSLPVVKRDGTPVGVDVASGTISTGSFAFSPILHVAEQLDRNPTLEVRKALETARAAGEKLSDRIERLENNEDELVFTDVVDAMTATIDARSPLASMSDRAPTIVRRLEQLEKLDDPEITHMASFYRPDLAATTTEGPNGSPCDEFIGSHPAHASPTARDVGAPLTALDLVAVNRVPGGTWPAAHRLLISQQVAVHAAIATPASGVTAVNGPPGTGKTTILRELYANTVVERAEQMCSFDDPNDAFEPQAPTEVEDLPPNGTRKWFKPAEKLIGHEMLVAGTSNKAVENVTRSIPHVDAMKAAPSIRYFTDAANFIPARDAGPESDPSVDPADEPAGVLQRWGLAALALGKRSNIAEAQKLIGVFARTDEKTDANGRRCLLSTLLDGGRADSMQQWVQARSNYQNARQALEGARAQRRLAVQAADGLDEATRREQQLRNDLSHSADRVRNAAAELDRHHAQLSAARVRSVDVGRAVDHLQRLRPSWWQHFTNTAKQWRDHQAKLTNDTVEARAAQDQAEDDVASAKERHDNESDRYATIEEHHRASETLLAGLQDRDQKYQGERPTEEWFEPAGERMFAQRTA